MWKQVSIVTFMLIMLFFLPGKSHAANNPSKKGEMDLKTERLHERKNEEGLHETELDKIFPDLFQEKTKEKIVNKQVETETLTSNLIELIFDDVEIEAATFYAKSDLFNQHYVGPKKQIQDEKVGEMDASISQTTFILSLILIMSVICGCTFIFIKKVT